MQKATRLNYGNLNDKYGDINNNSCFNRHNIKTTALKIFLTIILLYPVICFGQKQGNIWYFGNHAGLDFTSGNPVNLNDGQTYYVDCPACHCEGTSVIADSSGALLLYCNGRKVWNRNHLDSYKDRRHSNERTVSAGEA